MENYEGLKERRREIKARMNELGCTEEANNRIDEWAGDLDSQPKQDLEYKLKFIKDTSGGENGFTLRKDLKDEDLLERVVECSVIKILKKEIRSRQKKAEEARFSRRLHRW